MIAPSRPLWPDYGKALLIVALFAVAIGFALALLQTGLRGYVGPHPLLGGQQTFGEQFSLLLQVMAVLLPVAAFSFVIGEGRLYRRLRREGRVPLPSSLLLCGGGTLRAGGKRIVGLYYLTRDELGFVSRHTFERSHDLHQPLDAVSTISSIRGNSPGQLVVKVELRDGQALTLMPLAPKTWAKWAKRQSTEVALTRA